VFDLKH